MKNFQDSLTSFKNELEQTFNELELDFERNQNTLTKWIASSNIKLQQEKISQKKVYLLEEVKRLINETDQLLTEYQTNLSDYNSSFQQIINDFKNMEMTLNSSINSFINTINQILNIPRTNTPNLTTCDVQKSLNETIKILEDAQNSLLQQKTINNLNKSLNNLLS